MYAKQNQTEHLCLIKMSMMMTHKKTYKQKRKLSKYLETKTCIGLTSTNSEIPISWHIECMHMVKIIYSVLVI